MAKASISIIIITLLLGLTGCGTLPCLLTDVPTKLCTSKEDNSAKSKTSVETRAIEECGSISWPSGYVRDEKEKNSCLKRQGFKSYF
ncbi:MAG: hypothetical protein WCK96_06570 [Methylococcales bacterium]